MREGPMVAGSGPPLVLIPGIQGRWEWMRPAVRELARRFRVITFSLKGGVAGAFDRQLLQVQEGMSAAGVDRAVVCGVSYGGLIAVRFAATQPSRTSALVLVSTPGPRWRPDERARGYARRPWRSVPAFVSGARSRLWHEIQAGDGGRAERLKRMCGYVWSVASHPPSPGQMAARVQAVSACDFAADARAVKVPTLVVTGEPDLDRVVPVAGTKEYLSLIRGSRGTTLQGTGHIGLVTRPREFAETIEGFVRSTRGVGPQAD